ncbi:MAG: MogA/MoaB family molybdenum cofactor biosynthesis protein [Candidatus Odinarchaeia archaeon]
MSVPSEHKKNALSEVIFDVIIVSDSRYRQWVEGLEIEDKTVPIIKEILEGAGHKVNSVSFTPDDRGHILKVFNNALSSVSHSIITSGGTGLSPRDITIETLQPLFSKKIDGFGELLRYLSFNEIKASAMLTRATAGIIDKKVIFCLPGSPNAVRLALEKLILPEIGHILAHVYKG